MAKIETFKDRTKKSYLVGTKRSELMDEAQKRFQGRKFLIRSGWVYKDALYFEFPCRKAKVVWVAYSVDSLKRKKEAI